MGIGVDLASNNSRGQRLRVSRGQYGATLIEVTLGLIIAAIVGASALQAQVRSNERERNIAQADLLLRIKEAVDAYAGQHRRLIIAGGAQAIDHDNNPATPPVNMANVAAPTIDELKNLGYLPADFSNDPPLTFLDADSNGIPEDRYLITLNTTFPVGCFPEDCGISGIAYINTPITRNDIGAISYDGRAIGDIRNRLGVDGFSSIDNTAQLFGVGDTRVPNPLGANRPGVVAVRVGIPALGAGNFTDLVTENLTVTNQADIENLDVTNRAAFAGQTLVRNLDVLRDTNGDGLIDAGDEVCINMEPNGVVQINCDGVLDATRGQFISNTNPDLLMEVSADNGVRFSDATGVHSQIFNIPGAITVRAGELFVFNSNGTLEAKFEGGNIIARNSISGTFMAPAKLNVNAGDVCPAGSTASALSGDIGFDGITTKYFSNAAGELLYCDQTVTPARVRTVGMNTVNPQETCPVEGEIAIANRAIPGVNVNRGEHMICRNGFYLPMKSALPNFVLVQPVVVEHNSTVPKPVCGYLGANPSGQGSPAMVLSPAIEASNDSSFVRTITDVGASWRVNLTEANGTPLTGAKAVGMIYCLY
jgi:type II secretory pathway pseudopilin PulG